MNSHSKLIEFINCSYIRTYKEALQCVALPSYFIIIITTGIIIIIKLINPDELIFGFHHAFNKNTLESIQTLLIGIKNKNVFLFLFRNTFDASYYVIEARRMQNDFKR